MMTREETAERLRSLAERLEAEVRLSQTRDQHVRAAGNLAELRSIEADLCAGMPQSPAPATGS